MASNKDTTGDTGTLQKKMIKDNAMASNKGATEDTIMSPQKDVT